MRLRETVQQKERELKRREVKQRRRKKAVLRKEEELLQSRLKVLLIFTNVFAYSQSTYMYLHFQAVEEKKYEHWTRMGEPNFTTVLQPISAHRTLETAVPVPMVSLPPGEEGRSSPVSSDSSSPSTIVSALDHERASLTYSQEDSPVLSAASQSDQELATAHSEAEDEMIEKESIKEELSGGEKEHHEKSGKLASGEPPCSTPLTQGTASPKRSASPTSVPEELSTSLKTPSPERSLSPTHHLVPMEEAVTSASRGNAVPPCSSLPASPPQHDTSLAKLASPSYSSGFEPSPTPSSSLPSAHSPSPSQDLSAAPTLREVAVVDHPAQLVVGCSVLVGNTVKGVVRFIGETDFAKGLWIGVELDNACGKNDGSVQGTRYFTCAPNYGVFAPPSKIQVLDHTRLSDSVREDGMSSAAEEELESTMEQASSELASVSSLATPDTESIAEQLNAKKEHLQQSQEQEGLLSTILDSRKDAIPSLAPSVGLHLLEPRGEAPSSEHSVISSLSDEVPEQLSEEEAAAEDASQRTVSPSDAHMPRDVQAATEPTPTLHIIQVERDHEVQVNNVTQQLVKQLTSEAFSTIHGIWRSKQQGHSPAEQIVQRQEEKPKLAVRNKEERAERITDQLLGMLVESEVDLVCNIRNARKESSLPVIAEMRSPPPTVDTPPPPAAATPNSLLIRREAQAMGAPLAMVPSHRKAVNEITACAWNAVKNGALGVENPLPPVELVKKLCPSPFQDTRRCEESVLLLIFELAIETMRTESCQHSSTVGRLAATCCPQVMTLEQLQESVYSQLHRGRLPVQLPTVKYLHGNTRPGGKDVDFVDSILIQELRNEEPSWVDYEEDERQVKARTADAILSTLLAETVDILNNIREKRKARLRTS